MTDLPLDDVRKALSGLWDSARAAFWIRGAEAAASDRQWGTATNRLLHLTTPLEEAGADASPWGQLATTSMGCALRAQSPDLVRAVARRTFEYAWPQTVVLDDVRHLLAVADELDHRETVDALRDVLRGRYPTAAAARYAAAHFDERARRAGDSSADAVSIAEEFEYAAKLFEKDGDDDSARHCSLRAGVTWLTMTHQTDRGRALLRDVNPSDLDSTAQRWLAFARAHSPFWLDRVRSADWVGDVLDRASASDDDLQGAQTIASVLFSELPAELSGSEVDRLEALLDEVGAERRWTLEAQLRARLAVADRLTESLDDVSAAEAADLASEALTVRGIRRLVAAWNGTIDTEDDELSSPLADATALVLRELVGGSALDSALAELRGLVVESARPEDLRPVTLVLVRAAQTADPPVGPITELAIHLAARGPVPSFGFLPVAVQMFEAKLGHAGAALTRRAMQEGEADPELRDFAVARAMQWAVREGGDTEMLEWLTLGQQLLAEA